MKDKRKKYDTSGRLISKHKKIILSDGSKCELFALGHKNKNGELKCENLAADFYIKDIDFKQYFNINAYENAEKRIDFHFKKIKKRIENSNPDIILVMTYPTSFTSSISSNGVMCNLALHIEEVDFTKHVLDRQPVLNFLVERTIKEIRDSFV